MKRYTQLLLTAFVAVIGLALSPALAQPAQAINVFDGACGGSSTEEGGGSTVGGSVGQTEAGGGGGSNSSSLCGAAKQDDASDIIKNVINTILVVLGMVAVVMIVLGGIRYTTSNGDAGAIKSAKDTILYAVVGLVVAIFAFAIVNFVIGRLS